MSMIVRARNLSALLAIGYLLAGCASSPGSLGETRSSGYHVGRPSYHVGAPYEVKGVWYYPKVDYSYDETGIASWYGEAFNHQPTSNGEIFDLTQVSAAHKTLPLPSIVEVTNLQNGRSLRVRVNDRGPFVDGRIIDLSRRAAQLLGYEGRGTAPVRVRVLREESIQVAQAAMRGETGSVMVAQAATPTIAPTPVAAPYVAPAAPRPTAPAYVVPAYTHPTYIAQAPVPAPAAREPVSRMAAAAPLPSPPPIRPSPITSPPMQHFATLSPPAAVEPKTERASETRMAAATPRRHSWPSLISEAHADTLHEPSRMLARPALAARPIPAVAHNSGHFFIQAGAFAVPENAQRARARIATLGSVKVLPATSKGSSLYRVRLGPVASVAEAQRLVSRLSQSGYPGARVVAE
ncbi:MAG TPA: septal ring lytic transglycosylase RlpA family protein [Stellaceae bacterium]|jgi:rare lipoprotein A|nr:septal ring lytic transglycosylase RlpA family protein [Stellaceae bacterium]